MNCNRHHNSQNWHHGIRHNQLVRRMRCNHHQQASRSRRTRLMSRNPQRHQCSFRKLRRSRLMQPLCPPHM